METCGEDDGGLEERLATWREEQHKVAEEVVTTVFPDECSSQETSSFQRISVEMATTRHTLFGGVDVSFPEDDSNPAVATYVVTDASGKVVYRAYEYFHLTIPYVSSYLSFREIEPLQRLVEAQISKQPEVTPSIILVDGNGRLHTRRAGIACFLGVRTGIPTIGVGKTLYCEGNLSKDGVHAQVDSTLRALRTKLDQETFNNTTQATDNQVLIDRSIYRADTNVDSQNIEAFNRHSVLSKLPSTCLGLGVPLRVEGEDLCMALLGHGGKIGTRRGRAAQSGTKNPIFISVGHLVSLEEAVAVCSRLSQARIPEPVRQADLWGRELLRSHD